MGNQCEFSNRLFVSLFTILSEKYFMDEKYNFGTVCNWNSTKKEGRSLQSAKRKLQRVLQAMLFEAAAAES